jgi:uncharacterized protein YcbX
MPRIAEIFRYPVKGLSGERLDQAVLERGGAIPFDRAYAIENGASGFDPEKPKHFPKAAFLMLMRNEKLAELAALFDERTQVLTIRKAGALLAEGRLDTPEGRRAIEAFIDRFCTDDLRGPARIVASPGFCFSDYPGKVLSLINLETVRAIGERIGESVNPLRFRGNLYVDGLPAWQEFSWVGRQLDVGGIAMTAVERISRCAATNVDPETGARDLDIPRSLLHAWGHADCGIYLEIRSAGRLSAGDALAVV